MFRLRAAPAAAPAWHLLIALLSLPVVPAPFPEDIPAQAEGKAWRATVLVQVSSRLFQVRSSSSTVHPMGSHQVELLQVTGNDLKKYNVNTAVTNSYVINLESRPDRWERMVRRLAPLNGTDGRLLLATRFLATNSSTDVIPADAVAYSWSTDRNAEYAHMGFLGYTGLDLNLSGGERGCAMSHVRLWREIASAVDDGRPFLVLEDDAVLSPDFEARLRGLLGVATRAVSGKPDLLYLGYDVAAPLREKVGEGVFEAEYLWSTIGYLLWPQGAKKLLRALPVDQPVDNFIAWQVKTGQLRAFAASPKLVEPEGAWDIGNDVQHSDEQSLLTRLGAFGSGLLQGASAYGVSLSLPAWVALHGLAKRTFHGASSFFSEAQNVTGASLLQL